MWWSCQWPCAQVSGQQTATIVGVTVAVGVLLCMMLACGVRERWRSLALRKHVILLRATHLLPQLSLEPSHRYLAFLSHTWKSGQDQAALIKRSLQRLVPSIRIFLDVSTAQLQPRTIDSSSVWSSLGLL